MDTTKFKLNYCIEKMMRPYRRNKPIPPDILAMMKKASKDLRQASTPECSPSNVCDNCWGEMIIDSCQGCGFIDPNRQTMIGNCYSKEKSTYDPYNHFSYVLDELQKIPADYCKRFDQEYLKQLKQKLFSKENVYHCLPNKDQKYLNYIYELLTGGRLVRLEIKWNHLDLIKSNFYRCYREYYTNNRLVGKKPHGLNILRVIIDCHPCLEYIRPYIYIKFKLSDDIYNILKDVFNSSQKSETSSQRGDA